MDKPKESQVRTRVMDILRNHDQEARVIEAQIAAEKESLEYDLEEILMSGAYWKRTKYSRSATKRIAWNGFVCKGPP